MIRVQAWNEFVSPKFYGPLAIWPRLKISPQYSLNVIYLIITAWQWLMSFLYMPCIPMQIKPIKACQGKGRCALLLSGRGTLRHSPLQRVAVPSLFLHRTLQSMWICLVSATTPRTLIAGVHVSCYMTITFQLKICLQENISLLYFY